MALKNVNDYYVNEFPEILNEPWRSFPYEYHVDYNLFKSKEVRRWLNDNLEWREDKIPLVFLFSCEEDAMAFKLRWL